MTQTTRRASHGTSADAHRTRRDPHREARVRRSFNGVVASYLRELSAANGTAPRTRPQRELHA